VNQVKENIISWNVKFPMDRVWRKKYVIPFNSIAHQESNFIDQLFDLEEDKLFEELATKEEYVPNVGDWLKSQEQKSEKDSIESLREEFKDLADDRQDD
jgi:hypothetical protein